MPTTCTVTGDLQFLTGTVDQGYVLFELINFGDYIPRVIGTANMVKRSTLVQADSMGAISTTLWGNDNINPAGTLYRVSVMDDTKVVIQYDNYDITGGTFDLNSASPTPAPPAPTVTSSEVLSVLSTAAGNFTQVHTLGQLPTWADIAMTSGGSIYFQSTKFDATNLYLVASDVGVSADIFVYKTS